MSDIETPSSTFEQMVNDLDLRFEWALTVRGTKYHTGSFTMDELERLELLTGRSWLALTPTNIVDVQAMITVFVERTATPADALAFLRDLTVRDIEAEPVRREE